MDVNHVRQSSYTAKVTTYPNIAVLQSPEPTVSLLPCLFVFSWKTPRNLEFYIFTSVRTSVKGCHCQFCHSEKNAYLCRQMAKHCTDIDKVLRDIEVNPQSWTGSLHLSQCVLELADETQHAYVPFLPAVKSSQPHGNVMFQCVKLIVLSESCKFLGFLL